MFLEVRGDMQATDGQNRELNHHRIDTLPGQGSGESAEESGKADRAAPGKMAAAKAVVDKQVRE